MAPHSSTLAWKIPWTEEPGRLQSLGSLRVGHDWLSDFTFTFHFHALEKEVATHSSVLAWRIPGTGEPGGLPSMGSHRVRHNWSGVAVAVAFHDTSCLWNRIALFQARSCFLLFIASMMPLLLAEGTQDFSWQTVYFVYMASLVAQIARNLPAM